METSLVKEKNPVIASPTSFEELKENELVTASNVTEMMRDFVLPKLYAIVGVLSGLLAMVIVVVAMLYRRPSGKCDELGHGALRRHLLNNVITKQDY